jgi:hypothetical protein
MVRRDLLEDLQMKWALVFLLAWLSSPAFAATLAQWNFNSDDGNVTTGTLTPVIGSGSLGLIGGATALFTSGSANDVGGFPLNSAWSVGNYPAQGTASGTAGFSGFVSTLGQQDISISFDFKNQPSANQWFLVQASIDNGSTWGDVATFDVTAANTEFKQSFDISAALPGVSNNAQFGFRIVGIFAPLSTEYAGTDAGYNGAFGLEYDLLTVNANPVPEPTTIAFLLAGLLGVSSLLRRR